MRICSAPRRGGTRRFYYGDLLLQLSGRYGDGRRRVHVAADGSGARMGAGRGLEAKKDKRMKGMLPFSAPPSCGLSKKRTRRRDGEGKGWFSPGDKVDNARLQNRSLLPVCSACSQQAFPPLCAFCY